MCRTANTDIRNRICNQNHNINALRSQLNGIFFHNITVFAGLIFSIAMRPKAIEQVALKIFLQLMTDAANTCQFDCITLRT